MAFSLPPHDRRRPRRGSLDRPVNGRLYRAAFLLAVIPVIALALTVHRPLALPPPELPPTFDQETTVAAARELATLYPDRTPGAAGATGARQWVTGKLESLGYEPAADTFEARLPGVGKRTLANIVAIAPGRTPEAIVISAHRDNSGIGSGAIGIEYGCDRTVAA